MYSFTQDCELIIICCCYLKYSYILLCEEFTPKGKKYCQTVSLDHCVDAHVRGSVVTATPYLEEYHTCMNKGTDGQKYIVEKLQ